MARIAFVTWEGGGNVGPAIGLAQTLAERGHQIRFLGYETQRGHISAQGFAFRALRRSGDFDPTAVPPDQFFAQLVSRVWACPEHLDDVGEALAEGPVDALVIDVLMQGALAAAERAAIPAVAFVHSAVAGVIAPPDSPVAVARVAAVNAFRAPAGLRPIARTTDAWDQLPALITTIAELDTAASAAGPSWRYVGPIMERFADDATSAGEAPHDGRRLVLVSFSTTSFWDQRGRIRSTLAALADEPVRVLVSGSDATQLALPANAEALRFVPHARVLPSAAAVVTHCGHGTVTAALRHGVPVVGLPNAAADQPYLARRIADLGAGIALDGEAQPDAIRAAVRAVLRERQYAEGARRLGAAIAAAPGAVGAAVEVERAAGRR